MNLKTLPSWIKGGIVGLVIWLIIFSILFILCLSQLCHENTCNFCISFASITTNPIMALEVFGSLIAYILTGTFVGLMTQNKKK